MLLHLVIVLAINCKKQHKFKSPIEENKLMTSCQDGGQCSTTPQRPNNLFAGLSHTAHSTLTGPLAVCHELYITLYYIMNLSLFKRKPKCMARLVTTIFQVQMKGPQLRHRAVTAPLDASVCCLQQRQLMRTCLHTCKTKII